MTQNQQNPIKKTLFFIGSDCYNPGQVIEGSKIIKDKIRRGCMQDKENLKTKGLASDKSPFKVYFWIPEDNFQIEKIRAQIQKTIFTYMAQCQRSTFYLFYSGISFQNGDWTISKFKQNKNVLRISLDFIVNRWNEYKIRNLIRPDLKLIIFMDSYFSGAWCQQLYRIVKSDCKDIAIFASTSNQKSVDDQGGLFFNCLFSKDQTQFDNNYKKLVNQQQQPCFMCPQFNYPLKLYKQQLQQMQKQLQYAQKLAFKGARVERIVNILSECKVKYDQYSAIDWRYEGSLIMSQRNKYFIRHGYGKLQFVKGPYKGITYTGFWKNDQYHGKGKLVVPNQYEYDGQFYETRRHGFGTQIQLKTKQKYTGKFYFDVKHGQGLLQFPDQTQFRGTFKYGKRTGYGIMYYRFGRFYQGYWVDNKRQGQGLERDQDRSYYFGMWKNDMRNGKGEQYNSNLNIMYKGYYLNDRKHGQFLKIQELYDDQNRPTGKRQSIVYYENGTKVQN